MWKQARDWDRHLKIERADKRCSPKSVTRAIKYHNDVIPVHTVFKTKQKVGNLTVAGED